MSVLMGVPLGINDRDVMTPLPTYNDSPTKAMIAAIHVRLSQAFGRVGNSKSLDQLPSLRHDFTTLDLTTHGPCLTTISME